MIRILRTILKIDSQLGKNASQTAMRTRLIRALHLINYSARDGKNDLAANPDYQSNAMHRMNFACIDNCEIQSYRQLAGRLKGGGDFFWDHSS